MLLSYPAPPPCSIIPHHAAGAIFDMNMIRIWDLDKFRGKTTPLTQCPFGGYQQEIHQLIGLFPSVESLTVLVGNIQSAFTVIPVLHFGIYHTVISLPLSHGKPTYSPLSKNHVHSINECNWPALAYNGEDRKTPNSMFILFPFGAGGNTLKPSTTCKFLAILEASSMCINVALTNCIRH